MLFSLYYYSIPIHRTSTESRTKEKSSIVSFSSAVYSCLRWGVFHDCAVLRTLLLSYYCPYIMVLCPYQVHTLYIHRHGTKENPNIVSCVCHCVYKVFMTGSVVFFFMVLLFYGHHFIICMLLPQDYVSPTILVYIRAIKPV